MKTTVTGAAGFFAGHLVERLAKEGHEVKVLELPGKGAEFFKSLDVEVIEGDIRNPGDCLKACEGSEVVFHLAALAAPFGPSKLFQAVNVEGTKNIIEACRSSGVRRLVHVSSASAVCDGKDQINADETRPYPSRFLCHYSRTKAESEKLALAANGPELETVVIRPHAVWGPRDQTLFPRIILRASQGRLKQIGDGKNLCSLLYVENGVDALLLAAQAEAAAGNIYFITDDDVVLWEFIRRLLRGLGLPEPSGTLPFRVAYALAAAMEAAYLALRVPGEPLLTRYTVVKLGKTHTYSNAKARRELGFKPRVSLEEGLEKVCEWFERQGLAGKS